MLPPFVEDPSLIEQALGGMLLLRGLRGQQDCTGEQDRPLEVLPFYGAGPHGNIARLCLRMTRAAEAQELWACQGACQLGNRGFGEP